MKYFAYGSNMSLLRLKQRVPSAEKVGVFCLDGHSLRFHKTSQDGSAKCDAFQTSDSSDVLFGVLYEISSAEKSALDEVEGLGLGYRIKWVELYNLSGERVRAFTYVATNIDTSLMPYSWYLNHVKIGALESQLPCDYIKMIDAIACVEDLNSTRDTSERAIYLK